MDHTTTDVSSAARYITENKEKFLNELVELLKIPSVSTDPAYKKDVIRAAEFIKTRLEEAGADKTEICETGGYPIVYGEKIIARKWKGNQSALFLLHRYVAIQIKTWW